jgi:hypothetical protein
MAHQKAGAGRSFKKIPTLPLKTAVAPLQTLIIKDLSRCMTRCNPLLKAVSTPKSLRIGVK